MIINVGLLVDDDFDGKIIKKNKNMRHVNDL